MKKLFFLLVFTVSIVLFYACRNNNDSEAWREANTEAYDAIAKNPEYKALQTESGPSGVYYKVIKSGTGNEFPIQTSNVKVLYKGTYYDGTVFDSGSTGNDIPVEFYLGSNNVIRGFSFAIQNMVVGDKWEIWIPYYLGYGVSGFYDSYGYNQLIRGYTTLVFEIELISITKYP